MMKAKLTIEFIKLKINSVVTVIIIMISKIIIIIIIIIIKFTKKNDFIIKL